MFEPKQEPLLPQAAFRRRMLKVAALAFLLVAGSLAIGALGYHGFEGMSWLDATLNAAMILTGMGPVDALATPGGKAFAIAYCLFSGVVFLSVVALVLGPLLHRLLHRFHLEDEGP